MTDSTLKGYRLGYARVSTLEQDPALQHDALKAAGVERIFTDQAPRFYSVKQPEQRDSPTPTHFLPAAGPSSSS